MAVHTDNNPAAADEHDSVYAGLLETDTAGWAFGTSFDDPLAGIDTTVAAGIDGTMLAAYALALGDDALIMAHRLAQWCSRAPDLEEDVALSNIALDLLGQARLLLTRAAAADPLIVPVMPEGSPVRGEDALAFFRAEAAFANVRLAEIDNGDFAVTITRLLVFTVWRLELFQLLAASSDQVLAAVAAKGIKEMRYHRDYAARWFVTLAGGTEESASRLGSALQIVWPHLAELFTATGVERAAADAGIGVEPASVRVSFDTVVGTVFAAAGLERPTTAQMGGVNGRAGREGIHTEAMGHLLAHMQVVARAHPMGRW